MRAAVLVGLGGFLGALLRFGLSAWVDRRLGPGPMAGQASAWQALPWGTLTVNVLGCLVLGFLTGLAEARSFLEPEVRLFLGVGLLGAFTTYSTFAVESVVLGRQGFGVGAVLNVVAHVVLGLGAAGLGVWLGRQI